MYTWISRLLTFVFMFNVVAPELVYAQQKTQKPALPLWDSIQKPQQQTPKTVQVVRDMIQKSHQPTSVVKDLLKRDETYRDQMASLAREYDSLNAYDDLEAYARLGEVIEKMHALSKKHLKTQITPKAPTTVASTLAVRSGKLAPFTREEEAANAFLNSISQMPQTAEEWGETMAQVVEGLDPMLPQDGHELITAYAAELLQNTLPVVAQEESDALMYLLPRVQRRALYRLASLDSKEFTSDLVKARGNLRLLLYTIHLLYENRGMPDPSTTQQTVTTTRFFAVLACPNRQTFRLDPNAHQTVKVKGPDGREKWVVKDTISYEDYCAKHTKRFMVPAEVPANYDVLKEDSSSPQQVTQKTSTSNPKVWEDYMQDFLNEIATLYNNGETEPDSEEYFLAGLEIQYALAYAQLSGQSMAKQAQKIVSMIEQKEGLRTIPLETNASGLLSILFAGYLNALESAPLDMHTATEALDLLANLSGTGHATDTRVFAITGAAELLKHQTFAAQRAHFQKQADQIARQAVSLYVSCKREYYGLDSSQLQVLQDTLAMAISRLFPLTGPETVYKEVETNAITGASRKAYVPGKKTLLTSATLGERWYTDNSGTHRIPTYLYDVNFQPHAVYLTNDKNRDLVETENLIFFGQIVGEALLWVVGGEIFSLVFRAIRMVGGALIHLPKSVKMAVTAQKGVRLATFGNEMKTGFLYSRNLDRMLADYHITVARVEEQTVKVGKTAKNTEAASASGIKLRTMDPLDAYEMAHKTGRWAEGNAVAADAAKAATTGAAKGAASGVAANTTAKALSPAELRMISGTRSAATQAGEKAAQTVETQLVAKAGTGDRIFNGLKLNPPKVKEYVANVRLPGFQNVSLPLDAGKLGLEKGIRTAADRATFMKGLEKTLAELGQQSGVDYKLADLPNLYKQVQWEMMYENAVGLNIGRQEMSYFVKEGNVWKEASFGEYEKAFKQMREDVALMEKATPVPDYYEMYGLPRGAQGKEFANALKKAKKELNLKFHPDKVKGGGHEEIAEINSKLDEFAKNDIVIESKHYTRAQYDKLLAEHANVATYTPKGPQAVAIAPKNTPMPIELEEGSLAAGKLGDVEQIPQATVFTRENVQQISRAAQGELSQDVLTANMTKATAQNLYEQGVVPEFGGMLFKSSPFYNEFVANIKFFLGWEVLDQAFYAAQEPMIENTFEGQMKNELKEYPELQQELNKPAQEGNDDASLSQWQNKIAQSAQGLEDHKGALFSLPIIAGRIYLGNENLLPSSLKASFDSMNKDIIMRKKLEDLAGQMAKGTLQKDAEQDSAEFFKETREILQLLYGQTNYISDMMAVVDETEKSAMQLMAASEDAAKTRQEINELLATKGKELEPLKQKALVQINQTIDQNIASCQEMSEDVNELPSIQKIYKKAIPAFKQARKENDPYKKLVLNKTALENLSKEVDAARNTPEGLEWLNAQIDQIINFWQTAHKFSPQIQEIYDKGILSLTQARAEKDFAKKKAMSENAVNQLNASVEQIGKKAEEMSASYDKYWYQLKTDKEKEDFLWLLAEWELARVDVAEFTFAQVREELRAQEEAKCKDIILNPMLSPSEKFNKLIVWKNMLENFYIGEAQEKDRKLVREKMFREEQEKAKTSSSLLDQDDNDELLVY